MHAIALNRIDGSGFYAVDPARANGGVLPGFGDAFRASGKHLGPHLRVLPCGESFGGHLRSELGISPAGLGGSGLFGVGFRRVGPLSVGSTRGQGFRGRGLFDALHGVGSRSTDRGISPRSLLRHAAVFAPARLDLRIGAVGDKGGNAGSLGLWGDISLRFSVALSDLRKAHKLCVRALAAARQIAERAAGLDADATVSRDSSLLRFAGFILRGERRQDQDAGFYFQRNVRGNDFVQARIAMTLWGARLGKMLLGALCGPDANIERLAEIPAAGSRFSERVEIDGHVSPSMWKRANFTIDRNYMNVNVQETENLASVSASNSLKRSR